MRWYDAKLATLQKCFNADTTEIAIDDSTKPYLVAMPNTANEFIVQIASAKMHIPSSFEIVQDGTGAGIKKYNLRNLIGDFKEIQPNEIYFETSDSYGKAVNYRLENSYVFVVNGATAGKWTIYYYAYPQFITSTTDDDYEIPLLPEVAALLPKYMASQLYKEDDVGTSTSYWNEVSSSLSEIEEKLTPTAVNEEFISTKGW